MSSLRVVRISVLLMLLLSVGIALLLWRWDAALWVPSLTCNLLTTGIAIWLVNVVVADLERREDERAQGLRRAVEHSVKRQIERQAASAGPLWVIGALEIMEGLAVSSEKGEVARLGWRVQLGDIGESLRDTIMIFGRWLEPGLLLQLDGLQGSLRRLAREPQGVHADLDEHETWLYADHVIQVAEQVSGHLGLKLDGLVQSARSARERATQRMTATNPLVKRIAELREGD